MKADYEMWVGHSPRRDGTFRGLEKCTSAGFNSQWIPHTGGAANVALYAFHTEDECRAYLCAHGFDRTHVPVRVIIRTPGIGSPLVETPPEEEPPLPCGCHCSGGCGDPYAACANPCPEHVPF